MFVYLGGMGWGGRFGKAWIKVSGACVCKHGHIFLPEFGYRYLPNALIMTFDDLDL